MADQELEILIRTLADTHGVDEVRKAFDKVGSETKEQVKQTDKLKLSNHELNTALHLVGHQLGINRLLIHALFSPWTAGLAAVIGLVHGVKEGNDLLIRGMQALKPESDGMGEALFQLQLKAIAANEQFVKAENALKTQIDNSNTAIDTQKSKLTELLSHLEKLEMSQTADLDKQKDIKLRYGENAAAIALWAEQQKLLTKEQERSAQVRRLEEEQSVTKGLDRKKVEAGIGLLESERAQKEARLQELKKYLAEATSPTGGLDAVLAELFGKQKHGTLVKSIGDVQAEILKLQQELAEAPGAAKGLATAQASFQAQDKLIDAINANTNAILQTSRGFEASKATAGATAAIDRAATKVDEFGNALQPLVNAANAAIQKVNEAIARLRTP